MMQIFSFGISTILALAGIGFVVFGIVAAEFKPTGRQSNSDFRCRRLCDALHGHSMDFTYVR